MKRRDLALIFSGIGMLLAGCVTNTVTGKPQPPTVQDVKNWLQAVSQELPVFINELAATGTLNGTQLNMARAYLDKFQILVTQFLQLPPGSDPKTILNDVSSALATVLSFIPSTAPFVPLVVTVQLLIAAFLADQPVTDPSGAPVPPPAPPTPASLAGLHARTRSLR